METANDPMHHGKPKAAARKLCREERVEDLGLRFRRHAATRVADFQLQIIAGRYGLRNRLRLPMATCRVVTRITPSRSPTASDALTTRFITIWLSCAARAWTAGRFSPRSATKATWRETATWSSPSIPSTAFE